jgi:HEAT repeat protein
MNRPRRLDSFLPASFFLIALLALGACGPKSADAAEVASKEIRELAIALTPPPATSIPVEKSAFYVKRKQTLERLRAADEAHGLAALQAYREQSAALPEVRAGLLDIAAHTAPKACEELLVQLVTTFGEDLLIRRSAAELLGECMPERGVEVLEPILRDRYDDRTYPPEERMLQAWLTAMDRLKRDPVPFLSLVATDLHRPMDVRHLATRALGKYPSNEGRQALETLLVESSGNGYIRRIALQSLQASLPAAQFCELARGVQSREADTDFIVVIQSALDKSCR